jgi:signal transduction histidine kinase
VTQRRLVSLGALGAVLCAISVAVAQANPVAGGRGAQVAVAVFTIAALLGVGLYASYRDPESRFGKVLYLTGVCWFCVTLANSDSAALYSLGRIAGWAFEVVLAYALLSYPTGRLEGRAARTIVIFGALLIGLLYLPTIPITDQYPLPAPFTACTTHCPQNVFLSGSEPAVLPDLIKPVRDFLAILTYIGVVGVLAARLRSAGHNQRRTLTPVLGAAVLRFVAAIVYVALRRGNVDGTGTEAAVFVALLSVPATALGFLLGLLQWRVYSGGALRRLTTGLVEARDPAELRGLLAESLEEPKVGLFYADPAEGSEAADSGRPRGSGGAARPAGAASLWHDAAGGTVAAPAGPPHACVHEAVAESGLRVAVVCEEGFRDRPEFLDAVCACVVSGLERQRLDAALATSLAEVAASRKRLAGAADSARRRIERDLHDGAQQQLVALRVKLELAREALETGTDGRGAEMVAGLGTEVDEIIEEVRSLARGIYPALLASDGLGEALRAAGQRSPVPVTIATDGVGRLPSDTESAVYFCCLEALQNVAKHAAGATAVAIELGGEGELRFTVTDDGCGFAARDLGTDGSGVTGMKDRLAAVGGELWIESAPGVGTRVCGRVPLD